MTNQDVIALEAAGFTDDLIVAKIEASQSSFKLDTEDIIALKSVNLSERVIQAMLGAAVQKTPHEGTVSAVDQLISAPGISQTSVSGSVPASTSDPQKRGVVSKLKGVFSTSGNGEHPSTSTPASPSTGAPVPPQLALCSITIVSKPSGAAIFVDGIPAGVTPSIVKLQPGTYKLTLKAQGLAAYSQELVVEPGQVRSFGVVLDGSK
jgi:hypothetical protein